MLGALALQDASASWCYLNYTLNSRGAGMKGYAVLEIKVTDNKVFVYRLVVGAFQVCLSF